MEEAPEWRQVRQRMDRARHRTRRGRAVARVGRRRAIEDILQERGGTACR